MALCIFLFNCAQIKPPPGGPVDETPPKMIESIPADSSVNVPLDTPIKITFNEYIEGSEGKVAISPPVDNAKVKFHSKSIEIKHPPLDPGKTYCVVISSDLSDLRDNTLRNALSIAFSTGAVLDTFGIRGRIFSSDFTPAHGIRVYAYSANRTSFDPRNDYPDAVTWTGKNGVFVFKNLPDWDFDIIGILDENKDGFLSSNERIAFSPIRVSAGTDPGWSLVLFEPDSIPPELISNSTEGAFIARFRFSEPVDIGDLLLVTQPDIGDYRAFVYNDAPKIAGILSRQPLPSGKLEFKISGIRDLSGNTAQYDGTLDIEDEPFDSLPPSSTADKKIRLFPAEPLIIKFDKPVLSADIIIEDSLGHSVAGDMEMLDPFSIAFKPDGLWPNREDFKWRIDRVVSPGGAAFPDTTTHELQFQSADNYGNLKLDVAPFTEDLIAKAVTLDDEKVEMTLARRENYFTGEYLPAGRYCLYIFRDENGDSIWFPGSISPYRMPEKIFVYPDTIQIRGFWTTEVDITIN